MNWKQTPSRYAGTLIAVLLSAATLSHIAAQDTPPPTSPAAFATNTPDALVSSPLEPSVIPAVATLQALTQMAPPPTPIAAVDTSIPVSVPPSARLSGLSAVYQQLNRCSAAALTILLSYYDWEGDYTATITGLNPSVEDVAVRLDEMTRFVQGYGLGAVARLGGTVQLLKILVASGFPVLVENSYYEGEGGDDAWLAHNRVVMGYNDAEGVFYTYDSLLGNGADNTGRPLSYDELDARWRPFLRDYLVVYRPEDEALLAGILGADWDATANAERALAQVEAENTGATADSFTQFNRGTALNALGRYEEAAAAFDNARNLGLPWRFLWYQYGPFDAYLEMGRYDDVITLANTVLATTPGVEEMYYYTGLANIGLGNVDRAEGYLEAAIGRNRYYNDAVHALARLQGEVPGSTSP